MIMKKANTIILFVLIFTLFSGLAYAQKQVVPSKTKSLQKETVDPRIDNMGYWKKMA